MCGSVRNYDSPQWYDIVYLEILVINVTRTVVLEIMTLHDGMLLSTLSISSHGFALGFPKTPHTNEDGIHRL